MEQFQSDFVIDNLLAATMISETNSKATPMAKRKTTRGGLRPGAGRKPKFGQPAQVIAIRLPGTVVEILDGLAGETASRSDAVLELLAKAHKPIRDALKPK